MTKKVPANFKLLPVFSLILVIALSGCVAQNNDQQPSSVTAECDNMRLVDINDYGLRVLCYHNLAAEKNDQAICQKIEIQDRRNMCMASASNNADFCRNVENDLEAATCYSDVASALKDPSICQDIQSEFYRNLCIERSTSPQP